MQKHILAAALLGTVFASSSDALADCFRPGQQWVGEDKWSLYSWWYSFFALSSPSHLRGL
jgi:hypothetical protein